MSQTNVARDLPRVAVKKRKAGRPVAVPAPVPAARLNFPDLLEKLVVLAIYAWFFWRFVSAYLENATLHCALALISESFTVFFLLIRRPANAISTAARDWVLALCTTVVPLLLRPASGPVGPVWVGEVLIILGVSFQLFAKIVLGRSFGLVAAHRGLKQSGPYRLVRHPMYAGYLACHVGLWYLYPSFWNLCVYALCWSMQVLRVLREETHLSRDPDYRAYQATVRYRMIPGLF
jgi:protein-S-isoprenylcysteine O-methyltransferase Ste14